MPSFYQLSPSQSIAILESREQGLTSAEAQKRLTIYGRNQLKKINAVPLWQKFLKQFVDPMIILMIVAGGLALMLGSIRDTIILYSIVLANAVIGLVQEYKAENIIQSLQSFLAPQAKVLRDGEEKEVDASSLVPGDIVHLEEGDAVPADIRLINMNNLASNDFALTGESNPKTKFIHELSEQVPLGKQDNQAYLGTTIARGNAVGVVYATGMNTEIGKIARFTQSVETNVTPLEKEISSIAVRLTILAIVLAIVIVLINFLQSNPLKASLLAGLGIAAALVPQGLPAQLSVILSLGAGRLAQKKAIVKQLYSVETLGSTTIICSDKTGTITTNEMTVQHIWYQGKIYDISGGGYEPKGEINNRSVIPDELFLAGILASTGDVAAPDLKHQSWYAVGDPTEAALITLGAKAGFNSEKTRLDWHEVAQFPFDSVRKMMSSVRVGPANSAWAGKQITFLKGSPVSVLQVCRLTDQERQDIQAASDSFAQQSLRVLAVACREKEVESGKWKVERLDQEEIQKSEVRMQNLGGMRIEEVERGMRFLGLVVMMDPPREGVRDAIIDAHQAHVRTFMITGDQAQTAQAIAHTIGLDAGHPLTVIDGDTLKNYSDEQLSKALEAPAIVFARTSPEDKLRIVKLLRASGNVVAVTGDGVNDAPALKHADIGVAMGRIGTDVAKEAAEIVLTDDSYITLVSAIKEGRTIFANLRKTLFSTLSSNGGELVAVLVGSGIYLLGYPAPILAVQILLVDLVGEMVPLMALTFDPAPDDMMRSFPRRLSDHFLTIKNLLDIAYAALFMGGIAVLNFIWFLEKHGFQNTPNLWTEDNPLYRRALTLTYVTIMMGQFANILSRRHESDSIWNRYFWSNPKLLLSIIFSLVMMCIVIYTPLIQTYVRTAGLTIEDWLTASLGAIVMIAAHEVRKYFRRRKLARINEAR